MDYELLTRGEMEQMWTNGLKSLEQQHLVAQINVTIAIDDTERANRRKEAKAIAGQIARGREEFKRLVASLDEKDAATAEPQGETETESPRGEHEGAG